MYQLAFANPIYVSTANVSVVFTCETVCERSGREASLAKFDGEMNDTGVN